jgi:hypothetical protein
VIVAIGAPIAAVGWVLCWHCSAGAESGEVPSAFAVFRRVIRVREAHQRTALDWPNSELRTRGARLIRRSCGASGEKTSHLRRSGDSRPATVA